MQAPDCLYDRTMDREIVVRGEGELRAMPDVAKVQVLLDADGASRDDAYRAAAETASALDVILEEHSTALDRVTTAALVVQPQTRWRKGENVRTGWRASRSTVVEITDLTRVGELLALVTSAGGAISSLTWHIDPRNDVFAEARQIAGKDARQRAEQYASALSVKLGDVVWIAEPGLRASESHPSSFAFAAAAPAAGVAEDSIIDAAAEEITVRASVEVGFSIAG